MDPSAPDHHPSSNALGSRDPASLSPNDLLSQSPRSSTSSGRWLTPDPRASSVQSLVPSVASTDTRRRLLIVYIHGFYGNDQSFRSFPAHVHSLLKNMLAESHVIHSKIYPRYKTYKSIDLARDNFSAWMEPHEDANTDIILVGHSMGGLLAADVVLMPNQSPYRPFPFKHRILGTISLDSPFLGLHPGIIVSGISSLFQPSPQKPDSDETAFQPPSTGPAQTPEPTPSMDSLGYTSSLSTVELSSPDRRATDPLFDPPYWNDNPFREQPFFNRVMHFAKKHRAEGVLGAMKNHVVSHLEFGGCLADYPALSQRYKKLRALEDVDEIQGLSDGHPAGAMARVRFVNYYTLCSGRPKTPKTDEAHLKGDESSNPGTAVDQELVQMAQLQVDEATGKSNGGNTGQRQEMNKDKSAAKSNHALPLQSEDADGKSDFGDKSGINQGGAPPGFLPEISESEAVHTGSDSDMDHISMKDVDPTPIDEPEEVVLPSVEDQENDKERHSILDWDLPPLPNPPTEPTLPDLDQYRDKDARKLAEKESKRIQKAYQQATKDHAKAIREREKLLEKRRKSAQKESDKIAQEALKDRQRAEKEAQKQLAREDWAAKHQPTGAEHQVANEAGALDPSQRPKKQKKFCTLPNKVDGVRDPTWVDVYLDGVDEVGAHCGLFFPGPHYDKLVGDIGSRIQDWVRDDLTRRAVLDLALAQS